MCADDVVLCRAREEDVLEFFFFFRYCAGQRLAPHYRTVGTGAVG